MGQRKDAEPLDIFSFNKVVNDYLRAVDELGMLTARGVKTKNTARLQQLYDPTNIPDFSAILGTSVSANLEAYEKSKECQSLLRSIIVTIEAQGDLEPGHQAALENLKNNYERNERMLEETENSFQDMTDKFKPKKFR